MHPLTVSSFLPLCLILSVLSTSQGNVTPTFERENRIFPSMNKGMRQGTKLAALRGLSFHDDLVIQSNRDFKEKTVEHLNGGAILKKKTRKIKIYLATFMYTVLCLSAKAGFVGTDYRDDQSLLFRDLASSILVLLFSTIFVKSVIHFSKIGTIQSRDSRKIIHTASAPLFIICWPLFSNASTVVFFVVPILLIQIISLLLSATSTGGKFDVKLSKYLFHLSI